MELISRESLERLAEDPKKWVDAENKRRLEILGRMKQRKTMQGIYWIKQQLVNQWNVRGRDWLCLNPTAENRVELEYNIDDPDGFTESELVATMTDKGSYLGIRTESPEAFAKMAEEYKTRYQTELRIEK